MKLLLSELIKVALHAHDRGLERLKLPKESLVAIQKATDKMWYSQGRQKIRSGSYYYSPVRDPDKNILGYAAFQRVGSTPYSSRLVLTTILSKEMRPRGDNIGHFFDDPNAKFKGQYQSGFQIEKYKGMDPIPDATKVPKAKSPKPASFQQL